jgi:nucleoside-diphosphate-sugar epimerase
MAADLADWTQTINAVAGSEVAYLLVGLKYDLKIWRELWPRIVGNAIEACKRTKARLVFFDNVYACGRVVGPMTERTPFNPSSRKGEIRAQIATTLLSEIDRGNLTALIARYADFYGPGVRSSVANLLVLDKLAAGKSAAWLVNGRVRHSWTFTPESGRSLALLAGTASARNQTWHVPTAPSPPTGREFIAAAAKALDVEPSIACWAARCLSSRAFSTPTSASPTRCSTSTMRSTSSTPRSSPPPSGLRRPATRKTSRSTPSAIVLGSARRRDEKGSSSRLLHPQ